MGEIAVFSVYEYISYVGVMNIAGKSAMQIASNTLTAAAPGTITRAALLLEHQVCICILALVYFL